MKKIVCELCDGTEFVKEGGMFVCQGCGTKYTAEEAKSMMKEVEGGPVVGTPAVNPNQQKLDNILLLASSAYEADNKAEAENYCNQAIVMDAMCYKAWMLKGKAVGWQSKIDNLRIEEAAHSFCKAIDFAPEEEKESLKEQAVQELKNLGIALISLRKQRFSGSPDKEELNGFSTARKVLLDSLTVLLSHGNAVGIPDGYLEEIATLMNEAAVAALNFVRKAWNGVDHPGEKDFDTYLGWIGNIESLLRQAIDVSDDDDDEDLVRYKNLIIVLEEPMDAKSYKREWISWKSEYDWVVEYTLSDTSKEIRRKQVKECKDAIKRIEDKKKAKEVAEKKAAEEAKKARIKAYWDAHKEEKAKLDAEKKELADKKNKLNAEIASLTKQIDDAQPTGSVPSEDESGKVSNQIKELEEQRAKLGIFSGKEKKRIGEEIASLQGRLDSLKSKIDEEKKARTAEVDKKLAPIKAKKNELEQQVSAAEKRISAIEAELTKDPEA